MTRTIKFYKAYGKYGCFSNFSRHVVTIYNTVWLTSEHAYQAQKYVHNSGYYQEIYMAKNPGDAAKLGRSRLHPICGNWEEVKDYSMQEIVLAKFTQNDEIGEILLSTGDAIIIEDSLYDSYWGGGKDGKGKNKLGKILMHVRELIA